MYIIIYQLVQTLFLNKNFKLKTMKSITIKGSKRESVGKVATKALRNAGRVPCVVYGGDNPLHFSALELDFSKLVYTPNAHTVLITMENGTEINAILQDIQFHPVNDSILHIDFYQLFDNKEVSINVPVRIKGCLLYTSPSPRDATLSRMPSSA